MDEHDPHCLALLPIRRREKQAPHGAGAEHEQRQPGEPGQPALGQPEEAARVREAVQAARWARGHRGRVWRRVHGSSVRALRPHLKH